jgi:Protein of unknown function (DUF3618)
VIYGVPTVHRTNQRRHEEGAVARDPDTIQREIEQTRAGLADTIDAIAERVSPRRAASRGATAVKSSVSSLFGSNGSNGAAGAGPASVLDAGPAAAGKVDTAARRRAVQSVAESGGGAAYTGTSEFSVNRRLRVDRVLLTVGVAAAVAGVAVLWRSRR